MNVENEDEVCEGGGQEVFVLLFSPFIRLPCPLETSCRLLVKACDWLMQGVLGGAYTLSYGKHHKTRVHLYQLKVSIMLSNKEERTKILTPK